MRKVNFLKTWVMVIAIISLLNSSAVADVIQPMKAQLKQNLQDMSKLMVSISNELNTGKMSMEAQEAAASVTKQVSEILQKLSEDDRKYDAHKEGIDQMNKTWQPFSEDALTDE